MVSNSYSPDELESIFVWDAICEAMPLTAEERREADERDRESRLAQGGQRRKRRCDMTPAELAKERARDAARHRPPRTRNAAALAENRERCAEYYRLNKAEILDRQKERRRRQKPDREAQA